MKSEPGDDAELSAALLASPVRRTILDVLERSGAAGDTPADGPVGGLTAAQLAVELGVHVSTARFHLDQLEAGGLVISEFTTAFGVGRPRKVYAAAPTSARPEQADHLKLLAGLLADSFASQSSPEEEGARWVRDHVALTTSAPATTPGGWFTKLGVLIDVLRRWGYTPNLSTSDGGRSCRIELEDCPFIDLARANMQVVCGIHQGLLTGTMAQLGEDRVEITLEPFVGPNRCHAHVRTGHSFEPHPQESRDES